MKNIGATACIICGRRSGSGEHIFPAALGGRRVNKKIFCGFHNRLFSPQAAILADQLRAINALLEVRPDHSDKPTSFALSADEEGHQPLVSGMTFTPPPPPDLDPSTPLGPLQRKFGSRAQMEAWMAEQRRRGFEFTADVGEAMRGYRTEPFRFSLTLGGPAGLRAIGYVALTFLAHHFPAIARSPALADFKFFVRRPSTCQAVWWEFSERLHELPALPFPFGHRIVVGVAKARQAAYARISLFSTLQFAVDFGSFPVGKDEAFLIDLDPMAQRAPEDMKVTKYEQAICDVEKPANLTEDLRANIEDGRAQARGTELIGKIMAWHHQRAVDGAFRTLAETQAIPPDQRLAAVLERIRPLEQLILNLIGAGVQHFRDRLKDQPVLVILLPAVERRFQKDPKALSGLTGPTLEALNQCTQDLAARIAHEIGAGTFTPELLGELTKGALGLQLVMKTITDAALIESLPKPPAE